MVAAAVADREEGFPLDTQSSGEIRDISSGSSSVLPRPLPIGASPGGAAATPPGLSIDLSNTVPRHEQSADEGMAPSEEEEYVDKLIDDIDWKCSAELSKLIASEATTLLRLVKSLFKTEEDYDRKLEIVAAYKSG